MNWAILANIPAPASGSVEQWLWAFAALAAVALMVKQLFTRTPPIDAQFATKAELAEVRKELIASQAAHMAHMQNVTQRIHERIDEVLRGVSEINGYCKANHQIGFKK